MSDLKIVRENFNKVIDKYEEEDITEKELDERYTNSILKVNILANYFIEEIIGKRVPIFDEETKELITNNLKQVISLGVNAGMTGFVAGLVNTEFVEGSLNGQANTEE